VSGIGHLLELYSIFRFFCRVAASFNNTLILGPGGFRFGDYWRLGLPLEILVVAISIPLLLLTWPL